MAVDSPFASLQSLPSFDDGPVESSLDVLNLASLGSGRELSRGAGPLGRRSFDGMALGGGGGGGGDGTGGAAGGCGMVRSHTVSNPFDVGEMLATINSSKLVGQQAQQGGGSGVLARSGSGGPAMLVDAAANRNLKWIQPSGARQPGQGCEDIEQGIVFAEQTPTGGAVVRITLLAAGFIIGPSGSSVRDVCRLCGCDIKSWTCEPDSLCSRPTRQFRVEGPALAVAHTLEVMCDAVARYKELCEGKYSGQSVPRVQHVSGVDFSYQPPPRNVVPYAASLKSQGSAKRQGSGSLKGHHGRPPTGPSYKDALSRTSSSSLPAGSGHSPAPQRAASLGIQSMERSSALPPVSRSRNASPAPGDARGAGAGSRPASAGGPHAPRKSLDGEGRAEAKASHPPSVASSDAGQSEWGAATGPPAGPEAEQLPSPFGTAAEQGQNRAAGEGGREGRQREHCRGIEPAGPAHSLPAPTKTLDKDDVLRTVFAGMGLPPESPPAPAGEPAPAPATLPAWLVQELAAQQHQQQLAATAAAAQAVFPAQSSLLSELASMLPPQHSPSMAAPYFADGGGGAPQGELQGTGGEQEQLQAALQALGFGGAEMGQQEVLAALGAGATGLGGLQGGLLGSAPLDQASLMQLAASGLLSPPGPAAQGPSTPTPASLPAPPYPSPDHQQLLAALQALQQGGGLPSFGAVGSTPENPRYSPPGSQRSSFETPPRPAYPCASNPQPSLPIAVPIPGSYGALPHMPAAEQSLGLGLVGSAFSSAMPAPTSSALCGGGLARAPSSELAGFAPAPFSTFGGPGFLGGQQADGGFPLHGVTGEGSPFMSAFTPAHSALSLNLSRASSLAFAEGPTQPAAAPPSAGRSASLPLYHSGRVCGGAGPG